MTRKHRSKPWSLIRLHRECWAAPTVFLALVQLANERGSTVVTPTRDVLARLTGIRRLATISAALTALHDASWIRRILVPADGGAKTMLRIVIHRNERNTLHTGAHAVRSATRYTRKERHTLHDFPKGKGRAAPPLFPTGGASGTPALVPPGETNISAVPTRPIAEIIAEIPQERELTRAK